MSARAERREYEEVVPSADVETRTKQLEAAGWTIVARFGLETATITHLSGRAYMGPATRLVYHARPKLTARQLEALNFIAAHIAEKSWAPTAREIGTSMGIKSTNGVTDHLNALVRKGYLVREPRKSRAMRLVNWPVAS